jgi:hypothetical protein
MAQVVTFVRLGYALSVLVIGTLSITDPDTMVRIHGEDPAQAAALCTTLRTMETGLGAGAEATVGAVWLLMLGAPRSGDHDGHHDATGVAAITTSRPAS